MEDRILDEELNTLSYDHDRILAEIKAELSVPRYQFDITNKLDQIRRGAAMEINLISQIENEATTERMNNSHQTEWMMKDDNLKDINPLNTIEFDCPSNSMYLKNIDINVAEIVEPLYIK